MSGLRPLILGAVAYDPKVVTIWEGFKVFFQDRGLPFDVVMYTNYERQVEALLAGHIAVAWNSPLAWVRTRRLAAAQGRAAHALAMRDSDQDLTSVVLVRGDAPIRSIADLRGRTIATGAIDSPQATLLPLDHLRRHGLDIGAAAAVRRFDLLGGKHGDHIGGEREAVRALVRGEVDAACIIDSNHLLFAGEGTLPPGSTRILTRTGPYDHCNFTALAEAGAEPAGPLADLRTLLLGMSYADPAVRTLFDLEGLKAWRAGRTTGYVALEEAVDALAFYDRSGRITADGYRY
jgi:ABC-type phosphate/phosphonate transport system substrate-binding protein